MVDWLRHKGRAFRGPILDRLILSLGAVLVTVVVAFAVFYYVDQQGRGSDDGPVAHEIARLEQAVLENPEDMRTRAALAELYYGEGRYEDSTEQYEVVLSVDEENVLALAGLGRSLMAVGDDEGAIANFQKVIDISADADIPGDLTETAHYYMGSIFLEQGQADDAIAHLDEALAIERTDADAWHLLGEAYIENGDLDEAISALLRAVAFVPDFAEAYEKLVIAYEGQGQTAESEYARGMLAYSRGDYGEAETHPVAAIDASDTLVEAHFGLGLVRESQGEPQLALSSYREALRLDPENFNARAGLARLGAAAPGTTHGEEGSP